MRWGTTRARTRPNKALGPRYRYERVRAPPWPSYEPMGRDFRNSPKPRAPFHRRQSSLWGDEARAREPNRSHSRPALIRGMVPFLTGRTRASRFRTGFWTDSTTFAPTFRSSLTSRVGLPLAVPHIEVVCLAPRVGYDYLLTCAHMTVGVGFLCPRGEIV